jgi:RNA polymerase sigma-70 factor, ECF subfamily
VAANSALPPIAGIGYSPTIVQEPAAKNDDIALMRAMSGGDAAALESLYQRHAGAVFALCLRVVHERPIAEELLTDIFFQLWQRADRYDPARGSPLTYLMTLARSRAIDRQRAGRKTHATSASVSELETGSKPLGGGQSDQPMQSAIIDERRQIVRGAMDCLDPAQREAVELSFFDGLSHTEIAEKLGKPLGTVKTYIRQGLLRMRDALRKGEKPGSAVGIGRSSEL